MSSYLIALKNSGILLKLVLGTIGKKKIVQLEPLTVQLVQRKMGGLFVSVDACFGLPRKKTSGASH